MFNALTGYRAENRKGKKNSPRKNGFSYLDSKHGSFPIVFGSQIQTVPIRTCACAYLCRGKGHAHIVKNIGSRLGKRLLLKGISHNKPEASSC